MICNTALNSGIIVFLQFNFHFSLPLLELFPRNLKGGIGSLFDPCVNAVGDSHIIRHVWR